MGFRFRKRFSFGKFFRLNVSGSGLSAGLGPPGANINIGPRGTRTTFGIPGTGLSWVKTSSWKGAAAQSAPVLPLQPPPGIARSETPTSGTVSATGALAVSGIASITEAVDTASATGAVAITLAGMASSVVAYWVGSSNGSMQKNAALEKALAQK